MIDIALKADPAHAGTGNISFAGDLILKNMKSIYQQLTAAANDFQNLHITCHKVKTIDLAFLQMLYAYSLSRPDAQIDISLNDELNELIGHSGFSGLFNKTN